MVRSICRTHLVILGLIFAATVTAEASASPHATLKQLQYCEFQSVPTFTDVLRGANGFAITMDQAGAIQACRTLGAHLPSAREFAQLSMSLGAKGISEVTSGKLDDSYYLVDSINADGTSDSFYFSDEGYQRPVGGLGLYWFRTSSVDSHFSDDMFIFSGEFGALHKGYVNRYDFDAVRCVAGH